MLLTFRKKLWGGGPVIDTPVDPGNPDPPDPAAPSFSYSYERRFLGNMTRGSQANVRAPYYCGYNFLCPFDAYFIGFKVHVRTSSGYGAGTLGLYHGELRTTTTGGRPTNTLLAQSLAPIRPPATNPYQRWSLFRVINGVPTNGQYAVVNAGTMYYYGIRNLDTPSNYSSLNGILDRMSPRKIGAEPDPYNIGVKCWVGGSPTTMYEWSHSKYGKSYLPYAEIEVRTLDGETYYLGTRCFTARPELDSLYGTAKSIRNGFRVRQRIYLEEETKVTAVSFHIWRKLATRQPLDVWLLNENFDVIRYVSIDYKDIDASDQDSNASASGYENDVTTFYTWSFGQTITLQPNKFYYVSFASLDNVGYRVQGNQDLSSSHDMKGREGFTSPLSRAEYFTSSNNQWRGWSGYNQDNRSDYHIPVFFTLTT